MIIIGRRKARTLPSYKRTLQSSRLPWLRDGQRLSDGAHQVSIKTFEDFSVLEVASLGVAHNGNYTCALKNLHGSDAYSSQLLVPRLTARLFIPLCIARFDAAVRRQIITGKGQLQQREQRQACRKVRKACEQSLRLMRHARPSKARRCFIPRFVPAPEWVARPRDTSAALNGPASLDCLAVGYPTPTVRWSREESGETGVPPPSAPTLTRLRPYFIFHALRQGRVSDDVELRPVPLGGARVSLLANGTLTIREVRKEDAGRYRCVASNGLGQDLEGTLLLSLHGEQGPHTHVLLQQPAATSPSLSRPHSTYKPAWTDRQSTALSVVSKSAPLNARALLNRVTGILSLSVGSFVTQHAVRLHIRDLLLCETTLLSLHLLRQYRTSLELLAQLSGTNFTVYMKRAFKTWVPARFEQKFSVESVRRGDTAILRCEALGDSPMGVTWHRNEDPLPLDSPRLQVFESVTDRGTASELHVQGAERSDNGLFSCLAKNEVPSAPFDVKVDQTWSRSASVRWNAPYSGNSPVSKYIVQYWKDHGAAHRLEEAIVVAPQTSTLLRELQPGTSYIVRALAENTVGRGSPSESHKFQTKEEAAGSEEPYSYQSTLVTDQPDEEHLLSGLKRATEYSIVVKAFNAAGSGPDSQEVFARLRTQSLHCHHDCGSSPTTLLHSRPLAAASGTPPSLCASDIVHHQVSSYYIMSCREENGPWREVTVPQADNSKYTLSGLREATRYQIYLQAAGEGSSSAPSETITVLTDGGALSDASMPAPHGSQSRELPVYFRLSVVAPAAASLTIIVLVIAGACLFVSHERRKYKNIVVPPMKPVKAGTLGRPQSQRYVDVDQRLGAPPRTPRHADGGGPGRPLLGSAIPQYPAPYATLPLRCPSADGPSPSRLTRNAKGTSLSQVRVPQEPWDAPRSGVWCDIWASMTLTAGGSVRLTLARPFNSRKGVRLSDTRGRGQGAADCDLTSYHMDAYLARLRLSAHVHAAA
ncbi:hypothetical protein HPB48_008195 [Haemaphysalis longicornis]|uniref:Down syndrome cell adhesion molecule-like protein Dscam2 n=1 Tax=Haemaphysalis longicornis TaxID=44386 RepID=A0A9J6GZR6_HAELO|nr:hypothetical protein HPB48_008195 [Haemaphysalis longicornis]